MDAHGPRSQSVSHNYPINSQSRTSRFLQKVSNLKVRIRFSSSTTRNPKDPDATVNNPVGNGRGSLTLFHNPYPSQGQHHAQHRQAPSDDTYMYDGSVKPYMSQPSMLGDMIVEPFVPNSVAPNNRVDDEGDDADSMHLDHDTPTQTTRRFPFGRQKNSSQRSISNTVLPAALVVGAAQTQTRQAVASDSPDGLPPTHTSAHGRTNHQSPMDGLPRNSHYHHPLSQSPSRLTTRPTSPAHSPRLPIQNRHSQDTHRTTPSIVISNPSESFVHGVPEDGPTSGIQTPHICTRRPRSSLAIGDSGDCTASGLGSLGNANPHISLSLSRPSSSRSTASASVSISANGYSSVRARPSSPARPSSSRSSESERSYVSAVSQLVDALDSGSGAGSSGDTGHHQSMAHMGSSRSMAAAIVVPHNQHSVATRSSSDATILARSSSPPLPPRTDPLPTTRPPNGTVGSPTVQITAMASPKPKPPSRPIPLPPAPENVDHPLDPGSALKSPELHANNASSRPSSHLSPRSQASPEPINQSFSFPSHSSQVQKTQSPTFDIPHESQQYRTSASPQPQRPTLKHRTSSSSLKKVGQAISRKLSITKLRKDSLGEVDARRPSVSSSSRNAPLPPLPTLPHSTPANATVANSVSPLPSLTSSSTSLVASNSEPNPRNASPPRLTLPTYSHRFSLTTFTGGAIHFSNDDSGTPTLEVPTSPGGTNLSWAANGGAARLSPSVILRPPPLPIKNLPRLPTVLSVGGLGGEPSGSMAGGSRQGSESGVGEASGIASGRGKGDNGRVRLRSMPELLLTGPSRRGTMEEEQEESEDEADMTGDSDEEEEDGLRRPEERGGTALSDYTVSSFDDDGEDHETASTHSMNITSGRPSVSSSYRGSTLLAPPPSVSPTRNRGKRGKTHSRGSSYNFDASFVEGSPSNQKVSLDSAEHSTKADRKGKGKQEGKSKDGRPSLTLSVSPIESDYAGSPTVDLDLGTGLDISYILAATEQIEQNILGETSPIRSTRKYVNRGEEEEAVDDDDTIDTGATPTTSGLAPGKSFYQDYFSSKSSPPPLPSDAADVKARHALTTTPQVAPLASPVHTPRPEDAFRTSARFSVVIPPLPGLGASLSSRPSLYKHTSRSMIDFHALSVKEETDRMVKEEEGKRAKEERARRKTVQTSAMMLGDDEPLQHAFTNIAGGKVDRDGSIGGKRVSMVVKDAAEGVGARDRLSIVGSRQDRLSKAPPYEAVLEALKAEGREVLQPAIFLRRRRSLPTFNANSDPPPYPSFFPRHNTYIEPRDDEGRERLPPYTNHIYMCGIVPRKMEFISAGVQARDRKWRKVVCVLEGTSFKVYKYRPAGGAVGGVIGDWWRSKKNMSSANLSSSIMREESGSSTIQRNKLGEREEVEVVELKNTGRNSAPDTPVTPITPIRAQPRLAREAAISSPPIAAVASSSGANVASSSPTTLRSRLGGVATMLKPGKSHSRSQSEVPSNLLLPPSGSGRSPRPSLNLPSGTSESSGLASSSSSGQGSRHLFVPGASPAPSTRPTTPSSFTSTQGSQSRSTTRHSTSSDETPTSASIVGLGTAGITGPPQPPSDTGELIKEYTMQHAESGLGNDYIKRNNVIRVRMEGEQFLIQAKDTVEVVAWVEALQAAANVALDLDERPMPKGPLFPRRRRRRRPQPVTVPENANDTPIMIDATSPM